MTISAIQALPPSDARLHALARDIAAEMAALVYSETVPASLKGVLSLGAQLLRHLTDHASVTPATTPYASRRRRRASAVVRSFDNDLSHPTTIRQAYREASKESDHQ